MLHGAITRRYFVLGAAAAWPLAAYAQQPERMRRIGVLSGGGVADDPDAQGYIGASSYQPSPVPFLDNPEMF